MECTFFQQNKWLNEEHKNTYIICYKTNLNKSTQLILKAMSSKCNVGRLPKINTTLYVKKGISYVQINWLKNKYSGDFYRWNKHFFSEIKFFFIKYILRTHNKSVFYILSKIENA